MEAKIINPFIKATVKVLETMAFVKPQPGEPYLKKDTVAKGDVSSIVGLTGNPNGTISISFDQGSILKIVSNMFGEKMKGLDEDVADAVGELANMISGQARKELEEMGHPYAAAIPCVFAGKDHEIIHITEGPKIAIPFTTENGSFTLEVCFEK